MVFRITACCRIVFDTVKSPPILVFDLVHASNGRAEMIRIASWRLPLTVSSKLRFVSGLCELDITHFYRM